MEILVKKNLFFCKLFNVEGKIIVTQKGNEHRFVVVNCNSRRLRPKAPEKRRRRNPTDDE